MAPPSRNNISLNIAGGTDEYYDQICALSQKVINENFEILFQQREAEFSTIRFWDDQNNAKLSCDLHPPYLRLVVGASEEPEYYFELRIKKGMIAFKDGRTQDLTGFIVAVRAMLTLQDISPSGKLDQEAAAERAPYFAEVKKSYNTRKVEAGLKAGDYSVERLFTNILESNWLAPNKDLSKLPDPSNPTKIITFKEWEADPSSKAQLKSAAVGKVLSNWAMANDHSGLWTLGLQVKLPDTKAETKMATYLPIAVRRQNYPYLNPDEDWDGVKAKGLDKLYGRDYNCLLFCEVVQSNIAAENVKPRTLPAGSRLAFTGNLADDTTPGTYVLDHRTYFINRILKELRQLCVAVNVIPLYPEMGVDDKRNHYFRSGLAVGVNPPNRETMYPGLGNQIPADPYFDFKYEGPGEYKWSKKVAAPGSQADTKAYDNCTYGPIWRKWDMNSTQSVTVKWTPGTNKIKVMGTINYRHWEAYSTKHSNWGWNGSGNDPFYYGRISIDVTWSFDIILNGENVGVEGAGLVPEIVGIENGLPKNFKIVPRMEWVLDNTLTRLTEDVQKNMTQSLVNITKNLTEGFKNTGKLTYPGTRTLKFGSPQINNYGDIFTTITYQPLGDNLIILEPPNPGKITDPPVFDEPKPPQDSLIFTPLGHLSWNISFKYHDHKTNRAKLILTGSNASDKPFALDLAHIEFLGNTGKDATSLFTDRNDWETPAEAEERKEKAMQEWQQKLEEERQRQIAIAQKDFEASKAKQVGEQQQQVQGIEAVRKERISKFDDAVRAYNVEKARVDEATRVREAAKKPSSESATSGETELPKDPAACSQTEPLYTSVDSSGADESPKPEEDSTGRDINAPKPSGTSSGDLTSSNDQGKGSQPEESIESTDPTLSEAEKVVQAARAALDETEKELYEANAKLQQLSNQPFDEKMVVVQLPEPPKAPAPEEENLQTYEMTTSNIQEPLMLTIQPDGSSLFFKIKQKPKGILKKVSYRWYMRPGSSFTVTIEGTVGKPGLYAAQIQETWNSMDPNEDYKKSKFSDVFWKFQLLSEGSPLPQSSTQKEADAIRGIAAPSATEPAT